VSIHRGWVTRLSAIAEALSSELDHEIIVVNASVNGSTTRQALERMPYEVQSHGVEILLVQFGLNDCNFWVTDRGLPRVSPEGFEANLIEIVRRGIHFGAKAIFLHTNHPTCKTLDAKPFSCMPYEESARLYNQIIRRVAARYTDSVHLNDIEKAWIAHCADSKNRLEYYLLADGLHLNQAGHDLYYKLVERPIIETISQICRQTPRIEE